MYRATFSVIDLRAFAHNLRVVKERIQAGTELLVTVKANAYGHGVGPIIQVLREEGVRAVGVASLKKACRCALVGMTEWC